jgi:molecular chaperone GrpE
MSEETVDTNPAAPPEAEAGTEATEEPRTAEEELVFVREQLLRTAAELQNYRRRTEQVRASETAFTRAVTIEPFLGILDDLERSLEASPDDSDDMPSDILRDGVAMVHRKFLDELQRMGVTQIKSVGETFDESLHEALMQQPAAPGVEPGTIVHEVQKGYRLGDRILRHSKVIVAA